MQIARKEAFAAIRPPHRPPGLYFCLNGAHVLAHRKRLFRR